MKRLVAPALLAVTLLTGCSGTSEIGKGATPVARPTKAPVYLPALAQPLETLDVQKDPMSEFYQSDLSAEEKVTQLRIYETFAAVTNSASPIYETPSSVYEEQWGKGNITRKLFDLNAGMESSVWNDATEARRKAGFSRQVTGMYCPMRAQTLKAVDDGKAQCWYVARTVVSGRTVDESTWKSVNDATFEEPGKVQRISVTLKRENGILKVDSF